MDVTELNFKEALPIVNKAIDEASFLVIDTELTGLHTAPNTDDLFDTLPERYVKYRTNSSEFLVIQFGLSCFIYHPEESKYTHKDFNFYVYPRRHIKHAPDVIFVSQTSSMNFLSAFGFDFNKLLREGIPYLSLEKEHELQELMQKRHLEEKRKQDEESEAKNSTDSFNENNAIEIPLEHQDFIADVRKQVASFMADDSRHEMSLAPATAFCRKLTYQSVKGDYSGIDMSSQQNSKEEVFIKIAKVTNKAEWLKQKQLKELAELNEAAGFRRVIDYISNAKKLILGHNCFLDFLHIVHQFVCPVPETLEEYKEVLKATFPYLLDTKHMASSEKFKDTISSTHLGDLVKCIQSKGYPIAEVADGFEGYKLNDGRLHEAGYDAFITGIAFLGLLQNSGCNKEASKDLPVLKNYMNRMYILKMFDAQYVNIQAKNPEQSRDYVFHVTFPKEWETSNVKKLFSTYGDVHVCWIDNKSATVALKNRSQAFNVRDILIKQPSSIYSVKTFEDYKKLSVTKFASPAALASQVSVGSSPIAQTVKVVQKSPDSKADVPDQSNMKRGTSGLVKSPKKQKTNTNNTEMPEVSTTSKVFGEQDEW